MRNSITTTFAYNEAGLPLYESYSGGTLGGLTVSNRYDSLFRRVTNGLWNGTSWLVQATNTFDEAGRVAVVGDPLNSVSAGYSYLANSPLVEYTYFTNGSTRVMTTSRTYDYLNRLTKIESINNQPATINSSEYTYDAANQRTRATEASTDYWDYGYDDLGQVTSGRKYNSGGTPLSGRQFEYAFDTIGNRDTTVANGTSTDYTANLQNQYGTRVSGGVTETFTHDADGNLSSDSLWSYTWDGENRLVEIVSQSSVPDAQKRKLKFAYDYRGRRIVKQVFVYNNGYPAQPTSEERFVYDGWNLIAVLTSYLSLQTSFTWGLDLSGTEQGAGGVGGLLFARSTLNNPVATHFVSYDGNGNVMALVKAADGTVAGSYEYGPFGETVSVTGTPAVNHALRFSTKYQDVETGYLYYGYRYYGTSTGRWPSRDPLGERGGANLFLFVNNESTSFVDLLGACTLTLIAAHGLNDSTSLVDSFVSFANSKPQKTMKTGDGIAFIGCGAIQLNALLEENFKGSGWSIPIPALPENEISIKKEESYKYIWVSKLKESNKKLSKASVTKKYVSDITLVDGWEAAINNAFEAAKKDAIKRCDTGCCDDKATILLKCSSTASLQLETELLKKYYIQDLHWIYSGNEPKWRAESTQKLKKEHAGELLCGKSITYDCKQKEWSALSENNLK